LKAGESPWDGARREFAEELGVVPALRHVRTVVDDHGGWAYHTLVMDVMEPFSPHRGDGEGVAHRWCTSAETDSLPLHPGFAATWPQLLRDLDAV
jgi:ADP-ribose pyrophosphatase YjhB (NUDIX family)